METGRSYVGDQSPPRPLTAASRPTCHAVLAHGLMERNRTAAPKPINQPDPLLNEPHARSHRGRVKGCVCDCMGVGGVSHLAAS